MRETCKKIDKCLLWNLLSKFLILMVLIIQTNGQINFNYFRNGNFQENNCTAEEITTNNCVIALAKLDCNTVTLPYCPNILVYNQKSFNTTLTNILLAPLQYKESSIYKKRSLDRKIKHLSSGIYNLSFLAIARKDGNLSESTIRYSVSNSSKVVVQGAEGLVQFVSGFGTVYVQKNITINVSNTEDFWLTFQQVGGPIKANEAFAPGITDISFTKQTCTSNQTPIQLVTNQTACIPNILIQGTNYCQTWTYIYYLLVPGTSIVSSINLQKTFSCQSCIPPYKRVGYIQYFDYQQVILYGCTINDLPNVYWYIKTNIYDVNGKYYYTSFQCINDTYAEHLVVPGIWHSNYDKLGKACGIQNSPKVLSWQVVNGTYLPASCAQQSSFPVIVNQTLRKCQYIPLPVQNCTIYDQNLKCYNCLNNMASSIDGTQCTSCTIYQTFKIVQGKYQCITINPNCQNYIDFVCIQCAQSYTLSKFQNGLDIQYDCILTTSLIQNCQIYIRNGTSFQCYQCVGSHLMLFRIYVNQSETDQCLGNFMNIRFCPSLDYAFSSYFCSSQQQIYTSLMFTIPQWNQSICVDFYADIFSPKCGSYVLRDDKYECECCNQSYAIVKVKKSTETFLHCVSHQNSCSQCVFYALNQGKYQCKECIAGWSITSVRYPQETYVKCIPSDQLITFCTIYDQTTIGSDYQCSNCNQFIYNCSKCLENYLLKVVTIGSYEKTVCLGQSGQLIKNCLVYEENVKSLSQCKQCRGGYGAVMTQDGKSVCILNESLVADCLEYAVNGDGVMCRKCRDGWSTINVVVAGVRMVQCRANGSYYPVQNCKYYTKTCTTCYILECVICQSRLFFLPSLQTCSPLLTFTTGAYHHNSTTLKCPTGCLICISSQLCEACSQGFTLSSNHCLTCPTNCRSCMASSQQNCTSCFDGFSLEAGQCLPCKDSNCLNCSLSYLFCVQCVQGYFLSGDQCLECMDGCVECDKIGICVKCQAGFALLEDKTCEMCQKDCVFCNPLKMNKCLNVCDSNQYLNGSICFDCSENCISCDSQKCLKCAPGYLLRKGYCVNFCGFGCLECDYSNSSVCLQCFGGYKLLNNATCQTDISCNSTKTCISCPDDFILNNSLCLKCSTTDKFCTRCNQANSSQCIDCADGYFINKGVCLKCSGSCQKCIGNLTCLQCSAGYYLIQRNESRIGRCLPCDNSCLTCQQRAKKCTSCTQGMILSNRNICVRKQKLTISLTLGTTISIYLSNLKNVRQSYLSLLGQEFKNQSKYLKVLSLQQGSIISKVELRIPENQDLQSTYTSISRKLVVGSYFAGYPVLAVWIDSATDSSSQTSGLGIQTTILLIALPGSLAFVVIVGIVIWSIVKQRKNKQKVDKNIENKNSTQQFPGSLRQFVYSSDTLTVQPDNKQSKTKIQTQTQIIKETQIKTKAQGLKVQNINIEI